MIDVSGSVVDGVLELLELSCKTPYDGLERFSVAELFGDDFECCLFFGVPAGDDLERVFMITNSSKDDSRTVL